MNRSSRLAQVLMVAVALVACAPASVQRPASNPVGIRVDPPDAGAADQVPDLGAGPIETPTESYCDKYNREEASRPRGRCDCPCFCRGEHELVCAPCAVCQPEEPKPDPEDTPTAPGH